MNCAKMRGSEDGREEVDEISGHTLREAATNMLQTEWLGWRREEIARGVIYRARQWGFGLRILQVGWEASARNVYVWQIIESLKHPQRY